MATLHPSIASQDEILASVIITTYNRCDALVQTLQALAHQTIAPEHYEILVVDDGSTDDTYATVSKMSLPCLLRTFCHPENRGISAGRNLAIRNARGRYLICVSDDLLVPENFLATHIETLERFPGYWVVGGFQQLSSLTDTPFGRYLDQLEKTFEARRKARQLAPNLWEMTWPTARNLSLPRADLQRTGLFDEQFRITCEDQDLTHRARAVGIRFLYNTAITCLHNDQAGDLRRYCRFQRRGAHDTVLFCAKHPTIHGDAPIVRANGYIALWDGPALMCRKLLKLGLARGLLLALIEKLIALAEWARVPESCLRRIYRLLIGLHIFRGWREGLITLHQRETGPHA